MKMKPLMLIIKHVKKKIILRRLVKDMGGTEVRTARRKSRLDAIRKEKSNIAQSLINSWDMREIKYPTREEYEKIRFFSKGLSLNYLRTLQKQY